MAGAASAESGSADAMEALGVNINLNAAQIADCIRDVGRLYVRAQPPAMKNVAPVRKELGVRTIFNILGRSPTRLVRPISSGVFHEDLVGIQVRALQRLGAEHALVVYGRDGLDEISLGAGTLVGELKDGVVREYEIHPEDFGLRMAGTRSLKVENPRNQGHAAGRAARRARAGARYRLPECRRSWQPMWPARSKTVWSARKAVDSGAARWLKELVGYTQSSAHRHEPAGRAHLE